MIGEMIGEIGEISFDWRDSQGTTACQQMLFQALSLIFLDDIIKNSNCNMCRQWQSYPWTQVIVL